MNNENLQRLIILLPVFLLSLAVHEFAHAWVAFRRGDPTAQQLGRLTLNPLKHADFFGTFLLPVIGIYYNIPIFGWAKPVPVNGANLRNGLRDMALVAVAGPVSNILLAIASALLLRLSIVVEDLNWLNGARSFLVVMIQVNIMLCIFNLLPLPPLDGFRVVQGVLSLRMAHLLSKVERIGTLLLLGLFIFGGLRYLAIPIYFLTNLLIRLALS